MTEYIDEASLFKHLNTKYGIPEGMFVGMRTVCFDDFTEYGTLEPDVPEEPVQPVEPVEPVQPVEPVEPVQPVEPKEPVVPEEPVVVEPVVPVEPVPERPSTE